MRWQGRRRSSNVDDRRSGGGRKMALGGGLGTIVLVIVVLLFGGDPSQLLQQMQTQQAPPQQGASSATAADDSLAAFVSVVLADTEDVWNGIFSGNGSDYREPTLVLFREMDQSACGYAQAAMGPFYCPADEKLYIDLSFYSELQNKFGAPGDFAMAYVVAHEVGHHVQHLLGISDQVQSQRGNMSEAEYNAMSVRLELQADFLAGVWAHHAQKMKDILESGDIEEALNAANAIGDDQLQKQSQGYVVPDSFTHGTSEQRMRWFKKGFETGDITQGDTFQADYL